MGTFCGTEYWDFNIGIFGRHIEPMTLSLALGTLFVSVFRHGLNWAPGFLNVPCFCLHHPLTCLCFNAALEKNGSEGPTGTKEMCCLRTWNLATQPFWMYGAMATALYLKAFWKFPQASGTWVGAFPFYFLGNLSILFLPESLTQILLVMCQSQVSISKLKIYIYWPPTSFLILPKLLPHTWAIVVDPITI